MALTLEQLKEQALRFLEMDKETLRTDGEFMPHVYAFKEDDALIACAIADDDKDHTSYKKVAMLFNKEGIVAAITINDAYMRKFKEDTEIEKWAKEYDRRNMEKSMVVDQQAQENIIVGLKGPKIGTHCYMLPYERDKHGNIVFDEPSGWADQGVINILPDWWSPDFENEELKEITRQFKKAGLGEGGFIRAMKRVLDWRAPSEQALKEWYSKL